MKPINVLSFFDGISAGQVALAKAGIKVNKYISIEIDPIARNITKKNFPNTIFYGDITALEENEEFYESLPKIDLIFSGSPCQGLSKGGKRRGLEDVRSALFLTFVKMLEEIRYKQDNKHIPVFFENVVMNEYWKNIITEELGLSQPPLNIQASDYSPTSRPRLYWTNMHVSENTMQKYSKKGKDSTYLDILIQKSPDLNRVAKHVIPTKVVKKSFLIEKVKDYKDSSTKEALFKKNEIMYALSVATLIKQVSEGTKSISKLFPNNTERISIPTPNIEYWKTKKTSLAMINFKFPASHGYRVNRVDRKIPCFLTGSQGFDTGLGVFAFPKNVFRNEKWLTLKKSDNQEAIIFEPPAEVRERLGLDDAGCYYKKSKEYVGCHIMIEEALVALGFPSDYFSDVIGLSKTEKIKAIGNSWSVTIVSLILDTTVSKYL